MLKIHKPYKILATTGILFVSGALLVGYCSMSLGFGESTKTYATEDFSTEYRTISDITYMQDMNQQICSNTETPAANSPVSAYPTVILKDNRSAGYDTGTMTGSNGETHSLDEYVVVKLEDGNCWMQENLRLKGGITLKEDDSNVVNDWLMPSALIGSGKSVPSWIDSSQQPYLAYLNNPLNGVYYNWTAAIAMNNSSGITTNNTNANTSICPKGWELPTNGDDIVTGSFGYLFASNRANIPNNAVGSAKSKELPYRFTYAGYINRGGGAFNNETSIGAWWSRTTYDKDFSYYLHTNVSNVWLGWNNYRSLGLSVRCLALGGLEPNEAPAIPPSSKNGNITVNVTPTITLDVSDGVTATAEADKIATGNIEATVASNSDYDVLLSAKEPRLVGKENSNNYIPVVSDINLVQPGNDAWGILNTSGLYDPITTTPSPFDNTESTGNNSKTHTFDIGISISPSLPADTYSTEVTVTAATK